MSRPAHRRTKPSAGYALRTRPSSRGLPEGASSAGRPAYKPKPYPEDRKVLRLMPADMERLRAGTGLTSDRIGASLSRLRKARLIERDPVKRGGWQRRTT